MRLELRLGARRRAARSRRAAPPRPAGGRRGPCAAVGAVERHRLDRPGVVEGRGRRWGPSSGTASTGRGSSRAVGGAGGRRAAPPRPAGGRRGPWAALGAVERHRLDRPGVVEGRGRRWGPSSGTASTGRGSSRAVRGGGGRRAAPPRPAGGRRGPCAAVGAVERHRLDRPGVVEGRARRWGPSSGTASTGRGSARAVRGGGGRRAAPPRPAGGRRGPCAAVGAVERHRLDRPGVGEGRARRWGPSSGTASTGRGSSRAVRGGGGRRAAPPRPAGGRRGPWAALGAVE